MGKNDAKLVTMAEDPRKPWSVLERLNRRRIKIFVTIVGFAILLYILDAVFRGAAL